MPLTRHVICCEVLWLLQAARHRLVQVEPIAASAIKAGRSPGIGIHVGNGVGPDRGVEGDAGRRVTTDVRAGDIPRLTISGQPV